MTFNFKYLHEYLEQEIQWGCSLWGESNLVALWWASEVIVLGFLQRFQNQNQQSILYKRLFLYLAHFVIVFLDSCKIEYRIKRNWLWSLELLTSNSTISTLWMFLTLWASFILEPDTKSRTLAQRDLQRTGLQLSSLGTPMFTLVFLGPQARCLHHSRHTHQACSRSMPQAHKQGPFLWVAPSLESISNILLQCLYFCSSVTVFSPPYYHRCIKMRSYS